MNTRKRKRAFTSEFRIEVIEFAKSTSNRKASIHFGVCRSNVIEWRKKEAEYRKLVEESGNSSKRVRLSGGGRKLKCGSMEVQLNQWILEQIEQRLPVSRNFVLVKAAELCHSLDEGNESFVCSEEFDFETIKEHTEIKGHVFLFPF